MSNPVTFKKKNSSDEPYNNFVYKVDIDNVTIGGFTDVSGLSVHSDVLEYREGGSHDVTHVFQNDLSYTNATLRRGMTKHDDFVKWIRNAVSANREAARYDVMITMMDRQKNSTWGWKLINAYPVRWDGPSMIAGGDGFAMETLEVTYEELDFIKH